MANLCEPLVVILIKLFVSLNLPITILMDCYSLLIQIQTAYAPLQRDLHWVPPNSGHREVEGDDICYCLTHPCKVQAWTGQLAAPAFDLLAGLFSAYGQ